MNLIAASAAILAEKLDRSGCENGIVVIDVNPDAEHCPYERGACMEGTFGGRIAQFVTDSPIRAAPKVSDMVGAPLRSEKERAAACSVINVVAGFLCLSRRLKGCEKSNHTLCLAALTQELSGKSVYCIGDLRQVPAALAGRVVDTPDAADLLLVSGDGIIGEQGMALIDLYREKKEILLLAPSTAGVAAMQKFPHWCPYGR
ncbi:hypothetical protein [Methanosphaerula subterraneus]|uniref:hypothetical protein n=1 Tax=Methanosphaerula subterraneus TaxID=3350244 RepID=UPI003F87FF20